MLRLRWGWVVLSLVVYSASFVFQGSRWQLLLRPVGDVTLHQATQAVYAGAFVNEVMPLRFGEMVRAWLVSRWAGLRLVAVLSSLVVERLFDAIWLALGIGLTAIIIPLTPELAWGADVLGLVVVLATLILAALVFRTLPARRDHEGRSKFARVFHSIASDLQTIGRSPSVYEALVVTLAFLLVQAVSFWFMMLAFSLRVSVWEGAAVYLVVRLGTIIPNTPSNVGTYQLFTVLGLLLFGVGKTEATGFSLVVFIVHSVPLWGLGFLAFSRSGITLLTIREQMAKR